MASIRTTIHVNNVCNISVRVQLDITMTPSDMGAFLVVMHSCKDRLHAWYIFEHSCYEQK